MELLYMLFWIVLNQKINVEIIIIGILLCALIIFLNRNMILKLNQKNFYKKLKTWAVYFAQLVIEIIKANIHVAYIVLNPKSRISPTLITIRTKLKSDFYRTLLANAITLTPGTITVFMQNDELLVHCLEKEGGDGLVDWKIEQILMKLEE